MSRPRTSPPTWAEFTDLRGWVRWLLFIVTLQGLTLGLLSWMVVHQ